jgi:chromosome segregation ATPase
MRPRLLLLTAFAVVTTASALAAQRTDDPIRELLGEVKLLRAALERAATAGPRVQLLVARVQLQEQRIADVSRRLEAVRGELRDLSRSAEILGPQIERFDEKRSESNDPQERRIAEQQLAESRAQIERVEQRRQELTSEEAALAAQQAAEQGRWAEFNERLDEVERSLGGR